MLHGGGGLRTKILRVVRMMLSTKVKFDEVKEELKS